MKTITTTLLPAARRLVRKPVLLGAAICILLPTVVWAASTTWKLYSFNASGQALRAQKVAYDTATNSASFTFPETADAAYLTSTKVGTFGDMTGQTLSGKASITNVAPGTTFANYPGCANNPLIPTVGLYFATKATGQFNPASYWWSTKRVPLSAIINNPTALDTALVQGLWTDYNGQSDPAAFAAAVKNIVDWGVSFGGDCFYANGVGTPTGSADFVLQVTP